VGQAGGLNSTFNYGYVHVHNLDGQAPDAYRNTQRTFLNLVWYPVSRLDVGVQGIYGTRENFDGSSGRARQLQFVGRYFF
jgi:hypothetical protein